MNIRPFNRDDQAQVATLWDQCGLTVPWNDPAKDIERKMAVNPELFLVGEISGTIVATAMGGYEGHRGWVNYLAVSPAHQRQGLGSRMMAEIERILKQRGCPKINLQVRSTNKEVILFYNSLGYGEDKVISFGKRLIED